MSIIYILKHPYNLGVCKIGQTGAGARTRTSYQKIEWSTFAEFPIAEERRLGAEKYIHKKLEAKNVNIGGGAREIFSISPPEAKVEVEKLLSHFVEKLSYDVEDKDYWKYVASDEERREYVCAQSKPLTGQKLNELNHRIESLPGSYRDRHPMFFGQSKSIAAEYGIRVKKGTDFCSESYEICYGKSREYITREHFYDMDEYTLRQFCKLITRGAWATRNSWPSDDSMPLKNCNEYRRDRRFDSGYRGPDSIMSITAIAEISHQYEIDVRQTGVMYELSHEGFAVYISAKYFSYLDAYVLRKFCRLIVGIAPGPYSEGPEGIVTCRQCKARNTWRDTKIQSCPDCKARLPV